MTKFGYVTPSGKSGYGVLFSGYSIEGLNELSGFEDNGHGSFDLSQGYIWWTMQRNDEYLIGDLVAATEGEVLDHNGELIQATESNSQIAQLSAEINRRVQIDTKKPEGFKVGGFGDKHPVKRYHGRDTDKFQGGIMAVGYGRSQYWTCLDRLSNDGGRTPLLGFVAFERYRFDREFQDNTGLIMLFTIGLLFLFVGLLSVVFSKGRVPGGTVTPGEVRTKERHDPSSCVAASVPCSSNATPPALTRPAL